MHASKTHLHRFNSRATGWLTISAAAILLIGVISRAEAASVKVNGPRISLSDLMGPGFPGGAADLGPAPRPGTKRRVYRRQVLALLSKKQARLPAYWTVETKSQLLSCEELNRRVAEVLLPRLETGLKIKSINCRRPVRLPVGPIQISAALAQSSRRAGRLLVHRYIQVGQWPVHASVTTAEVDGRVSVLIAARDLSPRQALTSSDVRVEQRLASTIPSRVLNHPRQLQDKKANVMIRSGTMVRENALAALPMIRRGAVVTIHVKLSGIRVTSRGVARQDGGQGETITVLCQTSNRIIQARVARRNLVLVEL